MKDEFALNTVAKITPDQQKEIFSVLQEFIELEHLYESAAELVKTQLHVYDSEFGVKFQRNPIHSIESRIKSPQSMMGKLQKKGLELSAKSAQENLMDIAGIRVVCYYIDDIYTIAELLGMQEEYKIIKIKDYIKNPKPSGYRSLHVILMVPVYLSTKKKEVPVEIQIRTIAMDFWASLEHQLHYKTNSVVSESLKKELQDCAEIIADTDLRMQDIYQQIYDLD
ncbi:MAG: GTP pyrophosphokinase family protein [Oscillospiraceae bacterium]|nr:GTP pyrophosphokinase family protein [Oscillospiraceae bacterium]